MTEILKKPLSDLKGLLALKKKPALVPTVFSLLCIPLVFLFIFTFTFEKNFYPYLLAVLTAGIIYMIPVRNTFAEKKSEAGLQIEDLKEKINLIEAEIAKEDVAIHSFRDKLNDSSELKQLTEKLSMCLSLDDTSKTLSTEVNRLFGSNESTIILYLFHSETGELGISSSKKGQMSVNIKAKKGDIFDQWLVKTMQPLLVEDTRSDYRFDIERIQKKDTRNIRSLISVPLMIGSKALGVLRVDHPQEHYYTTEDLRFLTTIGDLGSLAIENAQLYQRAEQLAIKDGLTGLYLRSHFMARLPEEISRQVRNKKDLSFLMIDLDHFKQYNDKFGHVAGDIVLRTVGELLSEFFKAPGNLVCRYGGEEFCVLLPECTKKKTADLAEKLREEIFKKDIILRREKTNITVSIGVATYPKDAQSEEELIHKADQALYQAKEQGRNRVCLA